MDVLTWSELVIATGLAFIILTLWAHYTKNARLRELVGKLPGPPTLPIVGNAIDLYVDHAEFFDLMVAGVFCHARKRLFRLWLGLQPYVVLFQPASVEVKRPLTIMTILSSTTHITKSPDYDLIHPWLGTGLLTSNGNKWKTRRKLLTPSFHFRILEDFIAVFNEQSDILVQHLSKHAGEKIDIFPFVTNCSLDIICDSVMGRHVNAQGNSESEYVKATDRIKEIIQSRQMSPWLWPNWIFNFTPIGREHAKCLNILHAFTDKVIREKKAEWKSKKDLSVVADDEDLLIRRKGRLAFLDLLLDASNDGRVLNNYDIREEVDTFMFEGHDTTAAAVSWAIYLLGSNPHVQKKVHEELDAIFGDDCGRSVTSEDLKDMKYLECVIKETLRLFPSVPMIGRRIKEDVVIDGYTIPPGVTVIIVPFMLHRDPTVFPEPDVFDPDRFLPENSHGRHPYAYIPFSAGPRNCIGQKFALMEEKVVLSRVLRSYSIRSLEALENIQILGELILKPRDGINVCLTPRSIK